MHKLHALLTLPLHYLFSYVYDGIQQYDRKIIMTTASVMKGLTSLSLVTEATQD